MALATNGLSRIAPCVRGITTSAPNARDEVRHAMACRAAERLTIEPGALPQSEPAAQTAARASVRRPAAPAVAHEIHGPDHAGPGLRLQRAVFPELTMARVSTAQGGLGAVFESVAISLSLSGSRSSAVRISLKDTSLMQVNFPHAYDALARVHDDFARSVLPPDRLVFLMRQMRPTVAAAFCDGDLRAPDRAEMAVIVATQVVYARAIEYAFEDTSSMAGALGAQLAVLGGPVAAAAVPSGTSAPPATGVAGSLERARAVLTDSQALAAGIAPTSPGLSARFGIGTSGNLTLRIDSARPLAVGFGSSLDFQVVSLLGHYAELDGTVPPGSLGERLRSISTACGDGADDQTSRLTMALRARFVPGSAGSGPPAMTRGRDDANQSPAGLRPAAVRPPSRALRL
jgi:hypothetical protein